jgi:hypothetical protein
MAESEPETVTNSSPPEPSPVSAGYEFTADQNKEIDAVGGVFFAVGMILSITVIKQLYRCSIDGWKLFQAAENASWWSLGERLALVLVLAPLAYWVFRAASAFSAITDTTGNDIGHLMDALRSIRSSYRWVMTVILVGLGIAVVLALIRPFFS